MVKQLRKMTACSLLLLLAACSNQKTGNRDLYYWGNYQDVVYNYYEEQGNWGEQESQLRQIIEDAKKVQKNVAPGVWGQLSLVLAKQGKQSEAQEALRQEQALFPEARQFADFLQKKRK